MTEQRIAEIDRLVKNAGLCGEVLTFESTGALFVAALRHHGMENGKRVNFPKLRQAAEDVIDAIRLVDLRNGGTGR